MVNSLALTALAKSLPRIPPETSQEIVVFVERWRIQIRFDRGLRLFQLEAPRRFRIRRTPRSRLQVCRLADGQRAELTIKFENQLT